MRSIVIALAFAAASGAGLAWPSPAQAQTVIRACAVNNSGLVIRSRFTYSDWRGTRHQSGWVRSALGQRNCVTLQDVGNLTIEMEQADITGWERLCSRGADSGRNATLFVTGTAFNPSCALEQ
ncbi:MAG: hypothetical protein K2X11_09500 [Acetobacteraceae bacterium]|nr:hypothetical protein [Acetobacteraceae bacterium]